MSREGRRVERTDEAAKAMSEQIATLWGYPIVESAAVPNAETIVTIPMPTWEQVLKHGSFENYVEAMKRDFEILNADCIE